MPKTIKQIADELGVSKQRVYRFIKQNCINEVHQRNGVMYFDDAAEIRIKKGFSKNEPHREPLHEAHQNRINDAVSDTVSDAVIELLREELNQKNEQIRQLNERLAETTAALAVAQQTIQAVQQTAQAAQALHAGTIQQQLAGQAAPEPTGDDVDQKPLTFWQRIFGKRQ